MIFRGLRKYDARQQARNTPLDPGNARFATRREAEIAGWIGGGKKIRIGYWDKSCMTPLYFNGDAHITLIAPSGAGKGRDVLIPAQMEYLGSCVAIDPKGEFLSVTGAYKQSIGQRVVQLNPFNIEPQYLGGFTNVGFNPVTVIDPLTSSFGADSDLISEAVVPHDNSTEESHWTDSARQTVSGVIMMIAAYARPEKRNLVTLYEYISGREFFEFAKHAVQTGHPGIAGRLGRFAAHGANENREIVSILSTAITQCGFIGNDAIAASLRATGPQLRFADLRTTPTTVYLILPVEYFATCGKWFRLLIAGAVADLLKNNRGSVPVLFQLDEFAQVGSLRVIADLMGIGRGYGIQLWPVLQDLNQLEELYPKRWQTFLGNSGAQIFLGSNETKTAKYVSEQCGVMQSRFESGSVSEGLWSPQGDAAQGVNVSMNYGRELRPLLHPHEISAMSGREMLVFGREVGVIRAGRRSYLEMPECRGKYGPHPRHDAPPKRKR